MSAFGARYFFDAGSGTCLWAADDLTNARFGYAINHGQLGLSDKLRVELDQLLDLFDTSLDWSNPQEPSPWSDTEFQQFSERAAAALDALRDELANWTFDDETKARRSDA